MISTSSAARSTPARRTPPSGRYSTSLLRAAARTSCVRRPEPLADLGQQRLDAALDHRRVVRYVDDRLGVELLAEDRPASRRRTATPGGSAIQTWRIGWRSSKPSLRAQRSRQIHRSPQDVHRRFQGFVAMGGIVVARPRREVHRIDAADRPRRRRGAGRGAREERQDRRQHPRGADERGVQRAQRNVAIGGVRVARDAARGCGADTRSRGRRCARPAARWRRRVSKSASSVPCLGGGRGRARQDPPIEDRPAPPTPQPAGRRRTTAASRESGVGDEERVHVPEHEQLAPRLVGGAVAEQDVVLGPLLGVHPAHHVDAHALGRLVELDGVAPALVHRPAVVAEQRGVAEDRLERRLAAQHGAHRQHRVEPVAELAGERLGDEVGREPLAPEVGIGPVVHRRERDDARVEPRIAHVARCVTSPRRTTCRRS